MKTAALTVSLLAIVSGCGSSERVRGNGHLIDAERPTASFTAVSVSNLLRAEVKLAEPSIQLTMDENLLQLVQTDLVGSTLAIDPSPDYDLMPSAAALVTVSSPMIDSFDTSGSARIVGATSGRNVRLAAAGESTITATANRATVIEISASDNGHIDATGDASRVAIEASGAASVGLDSAAPEVDVQASDGAAVTVHATLSVRVRASGSAVVTVIGTPTTRDVQTSDQSRVVFTN